MVPPPNSTNHPTGQRGRERAKPDWIGKPGGMAQLVLRMVAWLYRARLGWQVGHRLLYLTHHSAHDTAHNNVTHDRVRRGRRAGVRREVVLDDGVLRPDRPRSAGDRRVGRQPGLVQRPADGASQ